MAACIILIFYGIMMPREFRLENYFVGEFAFHSAKNVQSHLISHTANLGFAFIHYTTSTNATQLRRKIPRIDGESVTLNHQKSSQAILRKLRARKVTSNTIGDIEIVYGYSPRIRTFITKNNQRINLQIATRDNRTTIGWPIILGSF